MIKFEQMQAQLTAMKCQTCSGLGSCSETHQLAAPSLAHTCEDCGGTGFKDGKIPVLRFFSDVEPKTTLQNFLAYLVERGETIHDVPQPYGSSVADFVMANRAAGREDTCDILELAAFLMQELDVLRSLTYQSEQALTAAQESLGKKYGTVTTITYKMVADKAAFDKAMDHARTMLLSNGTNRASLVVLEGVPT